MERIWWKVAKYGFTKIEKVFKTFNERYVIKIDEGNNYSNKTVKKFFENNLILRAHLIWYEYKKNENAVNE